MPRILIIGNCGAGKTHLSNQLSRLLGIPAIHLDDIYWEPDGFFKRRPEVQVHKTLSRIMRRKDWIMEGVFGELMGDLIPFSDQLIWLDLEIEESLSNLVSRGYQPQQQVPKQTRDLRFRDLILYASTYRSRDDERSLACHGHLFRSSGAEKTVLSTRREIRQWIERFEASLQHRRSSRD